MTTCPITRLRRLWRVAGGRRRIPKSWFIILRGMIRAMRWIYGNRNDFLEYAVKKLKIKEEYAAAGWDSYAGEKVNHPGEVHDCTRPLSLSNCATEPQTISPSPSRR